MPSDFYKCSSDADCGDCYQCLNGRCEEGTKYQWNTYASHEACLCAVQGTSWAEEEKRCCGKDEEESYGHCCPTVGFLPSDSPKWNNKNKRCDYCINHLGEGEKACNLDDDTAVYICQNGKFVESEACIGQNLCVDGKCSCALKNIGCGEDGLILDEETCTCVCPADKPVWDGSECVKEECENVNDCQEEFPDMSISCLLCENKVCKQKGKFCDGNEVFSCSADGKLSITSYPCDENEICINGECKCAENPICQSGEKICEGNILKTCDADAACPYWIRHDCSGENGKGKCEDGQCKGSDCIPGETRCVEEGNILYYGINNLVQICKENGEWGGTVRCDVRCKDGECVDTECDPGDERSGVDYVTGLPYSWICDEQGKWVSNN